MIIFWDLDGTLADASPFDHLLRTSPKNWKEWHANVINHEPHLPIVNLCRICRLMDYRNFIVTARSEEIREDTEKWLAQNHIFYEELIMRPNQDYRPDYELKLELLNKMRARNIHPDLVFEDRARVVQMYRENGVRCVQVAQGDY